jgi:hypothetical protein
MTNMPTRSERGMVTLWVLGCCLIVLLLGGLVLDMWRVIDARRELVSMADSAAAAGASALDPDAAHAGRLQLDSSRAAALATEALLDNPRGAALEDRVIDVGDTRVDVTVVEQVDFALLDLLGRPGVVIEVHRAAEPRR